MLRELISKLQSSISSKQSSLYSNDTWFMGSGFAATNSCFKQSYPRRY